LCVLKTPQIGKPRNLHLLTVILFFYILTPIN
jgi:hypothetical protein